MRVQLISVGSRMPGWVSEGYQAYAKRLPKGDMDVKLVEIPLAPRGKNADIARAKEKEGEAMLGAVGKSDRVIALDVRGKRWSTEKLADNLADWRMEGQNISLLVGGPDGLSGPALVRADLRWSLSDLTLPHPLVRVVLIEQLYRAWTLINGHPYHK